MASRRTSRFDLFMSPPLAPTSSPCDSPLLLQEKGLGDELGLLDPQPPNLRRIILSPLLQIVTDIPYRPVVARIDCSLGIVLPTHGIGLGGFSFNENGFSQR